MQIHASAPHFFVSDLMRSVRYYVDVLGFDEPELWGDPPGFAMPRKNDFILMLNQTSEPLHPNGAREEWDAYFWGTGVDAFYDSIKDRADIVHPPVVRELYGMKELGVRDPDGYMLVFAEDIHPEGD